MDQAPSRALDEQIILRAFAGHRELICEVGRIALNECPKLMQEIEAALEQSDAKRLMAAAHRMRGAAAQFRPAPLLAILTKMERNGRDQDLKSAGQEFPELRMELARFASALQNWIESLRPLTS